jgi:uncharacterized membrane protein
MGTRAAAEPALLAAAQGAGGRLRARVGAHRVAVGALTALAGAVYSVFALAQYYTFRTTSYDLVIFDEGVRSYAHFRPGVSIIKGLHNGFGPNFSILGDHWSPILASLAPLYWIYGSPEILLVAQAVLFALAIPPLWLFTRRAFGGGPKAIAAAYLVAVAYALSWPIASALAFDFHEVAFAPVLTAVALERLQAGRLRSALIALAALLLVKEDMGIFVAGIGIYLAVARPRVVRRQLLVAAALIVAGLADTFIATYVLIPAFGGRSDYYWAYTALGRDAPQAAWHLITHPSSLRLLITPRVKLDTMLWLFGAFCFLSLRSPIALATVPLLFERMLANLMPNWWVTSFQYNAYLVVVLVCAAVDGAARLDRALLARRHLAERERRAAAESARPAADARTAVARADGAAASSAGPPAATSAEGSPGSAADHARAAPPDAAPGAPVAPAAPAPGTARAPAGPGSWTVALVCAAAMCAVAVFLVPRFAFGPALHASFYRQTARTKAAAAADAVVPNGVTVAASNYLGPQLSARDTVLLWDGDGSTPPLGAPWVVANTKQLQFTFTSVLEQKQRVALLERSGYKVVFRRDGYVVLHRPGPPTGTASSGPAAGTGGSKEAAG